jgi:hypothetical protein
MEFAPIVADRLDLAFEPRLVLQRSALLGAERFQLLVACFERTEICGWGLGRGHARRLRRRGDEVERKNSHYRQHQRTENDGRTQGDLHEFVQCKSGFTEIHSYDWHRIKTRGKVFAIGGRATARFSVFFTPEWSITRDDRDARPGW